MTTRLLGLGVALCCCLSMWADVMADDDAGLSAFEWLLGEWIQEKSNGRAVGEKWVRVSDDTFEGIGATRKDGEWIIAEYLRLERMGDDVFMIAKPRSSEFPVPFKLVSMEEGRVLFENPTHDFPQQIGYRVTDDGITAWIEGPSEDGKKRIEFPYVPHRQ